MYLVGAILLGALVWLVHTRVHFQWNVFRDELQHVDWRRIILAVAMVVFCYWLRAVRWAVLIRPQKKVSSFSVLGSQVIGFTAVALFGRLADLVRPYLVAKQTKLTISSQVAVYTVERMFDLGAMVLIFSSALLLAPDRATLPHHEALQHAAMGGLVLTLALAIFAISVRASGRAIAGMAEKSLGFCAFAGAFCDDSGPLPGADGGEHGWIHGPIARDWMVHPNRRDHWRDAEYLSRAVRARTCLWHDAADRHLHVRHTSGPDLGPRGACFAQESLRAIGAIRS
jgi:hypothetical protein